MPCCLKDSSSVTQPSRPSLDQTRDNSRHGRSVGPNRFKSVNCLLNLLVLRSGLVQAAEQGGTAMAQAARKLTAKDPGEKLAHRRLTVLELARAAGQRHRGLPARRDRPDQLLRLEAALPARGPGRAQGPAADRQEPPDDHAAGGGGADRGAGADAPGLRLQPDRGAAGAGRPAGLGDHRAEDPQRQGPRHPARALAGAGAAERRAGDRADPRAGGLPGEAQPLLPRAPRRERAAGRAALGRHLHGRHTQGHRPGLPARRGRHPRLLRLRLPARQQAARGGGRGAAQRRPAVLRAGSTCRSARS